ncbi:hypothetical protein, partial [Palaeococcus sp. (in: euryarchaeotes)]
MAQEVSLEGEHHGDTTSSAPPSLAFRLNGKRFWARIPTSKPQTGHLKTLTTPLEDYLTQLCI